MDRRTFSSVMGLSAMGLMLPARAAGPYPDRPITLIVPYPAGGPSDTGARRLSVALGQKLGQPVVVENIAGASGSIGAQKLLRSAPNGLAVFYGSPNETLLAPLANPAVQYKSNEFRMACLSTVTPYVLVGRGALPANNIDELVKLGRSSEKPLSFGSVGVGSQQHLAGESIKARSGMNMLHVPYKGASPVMSDLLGGQIDLAVMTFSGGTLDLIKSGKLKSLGVLSSKRDALAPTLPTINEGEYLKDVSFFSWGGIFVLAKTPASIVERLNAELNAVNALPEVRASAEAAGSRVPERMTPAECDRFYQGEIAKFQEIAKTVNFAA
ncbi:hypothetical protein B2J88_22405 [Rhodococcus sp. SRB_17]|uniref:Bug family tripartite tricarboxylate transporter substrate binding protein n=1 Tax=Acidovorax sp. SRB_24 TaxID=1962700 RepID=UPI00145DF7A9|nr:tripartite tricarboxylate transporter substrate binding protein [Acidovorax sp. SRB_24]NMM75782.1 hypothetical protein [Acidovorax sp. SRB_24]NMM87082.1 hypothetical protein [Rhodococcus sp. SRB_17]